MPSITVKEYYPREGSPFSKKDAEIIGPVIQELADQGAVTARDVLDTARSKNSPLHHYFEWNDKVAADLYRTRQAGDMLGSIRVRYLDAGGQERDVRAFQINRTSAYEGEAREYRSFEVLHGDSAFAVQMLGTAFDDLRTWKKKYEPYVFMWEDFGACLQQVVNQVTEWSEEFQSNGIAVETDDSLKRLIQWRDDNRAALEAWTTCKDQVKYILEAIGAAENAFTKLELAVERTCIRCSKKFKSHHVGNRICKPCSKSQKVQSGVGEKQIGWQ